MEPYYVTMRIPGEEAAEFVLIQPLVPEGRANMIAWVAARMSPDVYGERIAFQFPADTTTQAAQIEARIDQNDAIAAQFGVWNRSGSAIIRGNLLVLPIGDDGLVYVEPIFLQAQGAPFPEFVRVIMVDQRRVAFAETVDDGLRQLLGEAAPPPVEEPAPSPSPGDSPPPGESRPRCRRTSPASWPRRSACTRRRRRRWPMATSARTRTASTSSNRSSTASRSSPGVAAHRMDVLVIGSGAREHARLAPGPRRGRPPRAHRAGQRRTAAVGDNVDLDITDPIAVARHAACERYGLVVIGPEAPLARASRTSSPRRASRPPGRPALPRASSRARPSRRSTAGRVPTAASETFTDPDAAVARALAAERPPVVKADWLAAGKGVVVPETQEAEAAIRRLYAGVASGAWVVLEERLEGHEVSAFALVGDEAVAPLAAARDYKRLGDADEGPNTGGMGAYAPVPGFERRELGGAAAAIFEPIAWRMARDGFPYRGVLYAGLMLTDDGPMVLEFNARFEDPEAQVLMPMLDGDLATALIGTATANRGLMEDATAVTGGGGRGRDRLGGVSRRAETGRRIEGAEPATPADDGALLCFHAATRRGSAARSRRQAAAL